MQNSAKSKNVTYRTIKARQANHNPFILPEELQQYNEKALYRYIARWSYTRNKYICCDDVAKNFGISKRLATNIISIIHRRYSDVISCRLKRVKSEGSNVIKNYLLVTDIKTPVKVKRDSNRKKTKNNAPDVLLKNARDMFLYRR